MSDIKDTLEMLDSPEKKCAKNGKKSKALLTQG